MADSIIYNVIGDASKLEASIQRAYNKGAELFEKRGFSINNRASRPLGKITADLNEFDKSLAASNARVLAFGASTGVIFGLQKAFRTLITDVRETQKALKEIEVILGATTNEVKRFGAELFDVANRTGQSFQTAAQAASEFSRQGLSLSNTLQAVEAALTLTRISGVDATTSVESLTAAVNTFNREGLNHIDIVNKMVAVDVKFAVSANDLAQGLKRVGSVAVDAGVELDQLNAAITAVQQVTARGGSVIGNGFKTIFTRLQRSQVREIMEGIGVATQNANGEFRNSIAVLNDLAQVFGTLSDQQQAFIAENAAGVFQINTFRALLRTMAGGELSLYAQALNESANAADGLAKRNEQLNQTFDTLIVQFRNTIQEFNNSLGSLTVEPALQELLTKFRDGLTTITSGLNEDSFKGVGGFIAETITGGIREALSGPLPLAISIVVGKTLKRIAGDFQQALKTLAGLDEAKKRQLDLEARIATVLDRSSREMIEQLAHSDNMIQKQRILNSVIDQTLAKEKARAALLKQLGGLLTVGRAQQLGNVGNIGNRSEGSIPNFSPGFAPGVIAAITKETDAIRKGVGGARPNHKPVVTSANLGKGRQKFVAHTGEYLVHNYRGGPATAVFNPNMVKSIGGTSKLAKLGKVQKVGNAASGNIPNLAVGGRPRMKLAGFNVFGSTNNLSKRELVNLHDALSSNGFQRTVKALNQGTKFTNKTKRKPSINLIDDDSIFGYVLPSSNALTINLSRNKIGESSSVLRDTLIHENLHNLQSRGNATFIKSKGTTTELDTGVKFRGLIKSELLGKAVTEPNLAKIKKEEFGLNPGEIKKNHRLTYQQAEEVLVRVQSLMASGEIRTPSKALLNNPLVREVESIFNLPNLAGGKLPKLSNREITANYPSQLKNLRAQGFTKNQSLQQVRDMVYINQLSEASGLGFIKSLGGLPTDGLSAMGGTMASQVIPLMMRQRTGENPIRDSVGLFVSSSKENALEAIMNKNFSSGVSRQDIASKLKNETFFNNLVKQLDDAGVQAFIQNAAEGSVPNFALRSRPRIPLTNIQGRGESVSTNPLIGGIQGTHVAVGNKQYVLTDGFSLNRGNNFSDILPGVGSGTLVPSAKSFEAQQVLKLAKDLGIKVPVVETLPTTTVNGGQSGRLNTLKQGISNAPFVDVMSQQLGTPKSELVNLLTRAATNELNTLSLAKQLNSVQGGSGLPTNLSRYSPNEILINGVNGAYNALLLARNNLTSRISASTIRGSKETSYAYDHPKVLEQLNKLVNPHKGVISSENLLNEIARDGSLAVSRFSHYANGSVPNFGKIIQGPFQRPSKKVAMASIQKGLAKDSANNLISPEGVFKSKPVTPFDGLLRIRENQGDKAAEMFFKSDGYKFIEGNSAIGKAKLSQTLKQEIFSTPDPRGSNLKGIANDIDKYSPIEYSHISSFVRSVEFQKLKEEALKTYGSARKQVLKSEGEIPNGFAKGLIPSFAGRTFKGRPFSSNNPLSKITAVSKSRTNVNRGDYSLAEIFASYSGSLGKNNSLNPQVTADVLANIQSAIGKYGHVAASSNFRGKRALKGFEKNNLKNNFSLNDILVNAESSGIVLENLKRIIKQQGAGGFHKGTNALQQGENRIGDTLIDFQGNRSVNFVTGSNAPKGIDYISELFKGVSGVKVNVGNDVFPSLAGGSVPNLSRAINFQKLIGEQFPQFKNVKHLNDALFKNTSSNPLKFNAQLDDAAYVLKVAAKAGLTGSSFVPTNPVKPQFLNAQTLPLGATPIRSELLGKIGSQGFPVIAQKKIEGKTIADILLENGLRFKDRFGESANKEFSALLKSQSSFGEKFQGGLKASELGFADFRQTNRKGQPKLPRNGKFTSSSFMIKSQDLKKVEDYMKEFQGSRISYERFSNFLRGEGISPVLLTAAQGLIPNYARQGFFNKSRTINADAYRNILPNKGPLVSNQSLAALNTYQGSNGALIKDFLEGVSKTYLGGLISARRAGSSNSLTAEQLIFDKGQRDQWTKLLDQVVRGNIKTPRNENDLVALLESKNLNLRHPEFRALGQPNNIPNFTPIADALNREAKALSQAGYSRGQIQQNLAVGTNTSLATKGNRGGHFVYNTLQQNKNNAISNHTGGFNGAYHDMLHVANGTFPNFAPGDEIIKLLSQLPREVRASVINSSSNTLSKNEKEILNSALRVADLENSKSTASSKSEIDRIDRAIAKASNPKNNKKFRASVAASGLGSIDSLKLIQQGIIDIPEGQISSSSRSKILELTDTTEIQREARRAGQVERSRLESAPIQTKINQAVAGLGKSSKAKPADLTIARDNTETPTRRLNALNRILTAQGQTLKGSPTSNKRREDVLKQTFGKQVDARVKKVVQDTNISETQRRFADLSKSMNGLITEQQRLAAAEVQTNRILEKSNKSLEKRGSLFDAGIDSRVTNNTLIKEEARLIAKRDGLSQAEERRLEKQLRRDNSIRGAGRAGGFLNRTLGRTRDKDIVNRRLTTSEGFVEANKNLKAEIENRRKAKKEKFAGKAFAASFALPFLSPVIAQGAASFTNTEQGASRAQNITSGVIEGGTIFALLAGLNLPIAAAAGGFTVLSSIAKSLGEDFEILASEAQNFTSKVQAQIQAAEQIVFGEQRVEDLIKSGASNSDIAVAQREFVANSLRLTDNNLRIQLARTRNPEEKRELLANERQDFIRKSSGKEFSALLEQFFDKGERELSVLSAPFNGRTSAFNATDINNLSNSLLSSFDQSNLSQADRARIATAFQNEDFGQIGNIFANNNGFANIRGEDLKKLEDNQIGFGTSKVGTIVGRSIGRTANSLEFLKEEIGLRLALNLEQENLNKLLIESRSQLTQFKVNLESIIGLFSSSRELEARGQSNDFEIGLNRAQRALETRAPFLSESANLSAGFRISQQQAIQRANSDRRGIINNSISAFGDLINKTDNSSTAQNLKPILQGLVENSNLEPNNVIDALVEARELITNVEGSTSKSFLEVSDILNNISNSDKAVQQELEKQSTILKDSYKAALEQVRLQKELGFAGGFQSTLDANLDEINSRAFEGALAAYVDPIADFEDGVKKIRDAQTEFGRNSPERRAALAQVETDRFERNQNFLTYLRDQVANGFISPPNLGPNATIEERKQARLQFEQERQPLVDRAVRAQTGNLGLIAKNNFQGRFQGIIDELSREENTALAQRVRRAYGDDFGSSNIGSKIQNGQFASAERDLFNLQQLLLREGKDAPARQIEFFLDELKVSAKDPEARRRAAESQVLAEIFNEESNTELENAITALTGVNGEQVVSLQSIDNRMGSMVEILQRQLEIASESKAIQEASERVKTSQADKVSVVTEQGILAEEARKRDIFRRSNGFKDVRKFDTQANADVLSILSEATGVNVDSIAPLDTLLNQGFSIGSILDNISVNPNLKDSLNQNKDLRKLLENVARSERQSGIKDVTGITKGENISKAFQNLGKRSNKLTTSINTGRAEVERLEGQSELKTLNLTLDQINKAFDAIQQRQNNGATPQQNTLLEKRKQKLRDSATKARERKREIEQSLGLSFLNPIQNTFSPIKAIGNNVTALARPANLGNTIIENAGLIEYLDSGTGVTPSLPKTDPTRGLLSDKNKSETPTLQAERQANRFASISEIDKKARELAKGRTPTKTDYEAAEYLIRTGNSKLTSFISAGAQIDAQIAADNGIAQRTSGLNEKEQTKALEDYLFNLYNGASLEEVEARLTSEKPLPTATVSATSGNNILDLVGSTRNNLRTAKRIGPTRLADNKTASNSTVSELPASLMVFETTKRIDDAASFIPKPLNFPTPEQNIYRTAARNVGQELLLEELLRAMSGGFPFFAQGTTGIKNPSIKDQFNQRRSGIVSEFANSPSDLENKLKQLRDSFYLPDFKKDTLNRTAGNLGIFPSSRNFEQLKNLSVAESGPSFLETIKGLDTALVQILADAAPKIPVTVTDVKSNKPQKTNSQRAIDDLFRDRPNEEKQAFQNALKRNPFEEARKAREISQITELPVTVRDVGRNPFEGVPRTNFQDSSLTQFGGLFPRPAIRAIPIPLPPSVQRDANGNIQTDFSDSPVFEGRKTNPDLDATTGRVQSTIPTGDLNLIQRIQRNRREKGKRLFIGGGGLLGGAGIAFPSIDARQALNTQQSSATVARNNGTDAEFRQALQSEYESKLLKQLEALRNDIKIVKDIDNKVQSSPKGETIVKNSPNFTINLNARTIDKDASAELISMLQREIKKLETKIEKYSKEFNVDLSIPEDMQQVLKP